VPESAEILALVEHGYLRLTDIAPILAVTIQRVSQIVAEREDFPEPAKWSGGIGCGDARTWSGGGRPASGVGTCGMTSAGGYEHPPVPLGVRGTSPSR
jgi:hypothetical protein